MLFRSSYTDPNITRFRPTMSNAQLTVNNEQLGWFTKSDAQYRVGNSRTFSYVVQGWRESDAPGARLWAPNMLVPITDPYLGLDAKNGTMLIESVDFTQSDKGTLTTLGVCFMEKYTAKVELDRIKTVFDLGAPDQVKT